MDKQRVGLVGRNGIGKSILASIISGGVAPSSGDLVAPSSTAIFHQQSSVLPEDDISIAEYLNMHHVLEALDHIRMGNCSQEWFDLIGQDWDVESRLERELINLRIPDDLLFPCRQLSGGQFARLALWKLFKQQSDLLILDEPSNHMDSSSKQWLINTMETFSGAILLISHDRKLLNTVDEIWELSSTGLEIYGGNYQFYTAKKQSEQLAIERQLVTIKKEKKHLDIQTQRNLEKAQQRATKGKKLRRSGSQAKVLLNGMKESAENSASNRSKLAHTRKTRLYQQELLLTERQDKWKTQKFNIQESSDTTTARHSYLNGKLKFGNNIRLNLQLFYGEKVHIQGPNGCGKSTLLKTLLGKLPLREGDINTKGHFCYLDQNLTIINPNLSVLDNFFSHVASIPHSDVRTLLAGIGFRGDNVFKPASVLSGGETIKLAMLIIGHQINQPVLLLDEPDNHLDLDSKTELASALRRYKTGYVLVTHDDNFAYDCGITRSYLMTDSGLDLEEH
ncbi:ATP-binding cassette domain-containing protein [Vibrio sp. OCN044]|uniref:ATP-binding cassette domain-containing protein n=2 Tax=Vibrio tetraodonis TaxID=2231647 RepID=A0A6L8LV92_9VIBR|nr:ATP-binding cassette domain-containing protein [Vibrio tetraodonis subsp. pristinus]